MHQNKILNDLDLGDWNRIEIVACFCKDKQFEDRSISYVVDVCARTAMVIPSAVNDADGRTDESDSSDEFSDTGLNKNGKAMHENVLGDQNSAPQHKSSPKKSDYAVNSRSHGNISSIVSSVP